MRKRLVIFQQDIITRFQPFNQLIFHQQGLGLVFNDNKLHPPDFRNHPLQTIGQFVNMRIGNDSFLDVFCFADIQHFFVGTDHPVHTGLFRRYLNVFL